MSSSPVNPNTIKKSANVTPTGAAGGPTPPDAQAQLQVPLSPQTAFVSQDPRKPADADAQAQAIAGFASIASGGAKTVPGKDDTTVLVKGDGQTNGQFAAAVGSLFGGDAAGLASGGSFKLPAGYAKEVARLIDAVDVKASGDAHNIVLKKGSNGIFGYLLSADADINTSVQKLFGKNIVTFGADGSLSIVDNKVRSAMVRLSASGVSAFGGTVTAAVMGTFSMSGLNSLRAMAAYKSLLSEMGGDGATGQRVRIDSASLDITFDEKQPGKMTLDQFKASIAAIFFQGDANQVQLSGTVVKAGSGIDATLLAGFQRATKNTKINLSDQIELKDGAVAQDIQADLQLMTGKTTVVSKNTVQLANSSIQAIGIDEELTTTFGAGATLKATFNATMDSEGRWTGSGMAALKGLKIGATLVDRLDGTFEIKNNSLDAAAFEAAVQRFSAIVKVEGKYVVGKGFEGGAEFLDTWNNVNVDLGGNLVVNPGGDISGALRASIAATIGTGLSFTAKNEMLFEHGQWIKDDFNAEMISKFGSGGDLDVQLKGTVTRDGLQSFDLTAALKSLKIGAHREPPGTLSADTAWHIVNDSLTDFQFKAALSALVGEENVDAVIQGQWTPKLFQLKADFSATWEKTYIGLDGDLAIVDGKVSGTGEEDFRGFLGPMATNLKNKIAFKNGEFLNDEINANAKAKFGDGASLEGTIDATITKDGIQQANVFIAMKYLVSEANKGNITINASGGYSFKGDTEAIRAALKIVSGDDSGELSGTVDLKRGKFQSASFKDKFNLALNGFQVGADGSIQVKRGAGGQPVLSVDEQVHASGSFGDRAGFEASGKLTYDKTGLHVDDLDATLTMQISKTNPSFKISTNFSEEDGKLKAQISIGAMQTLKQLAQPADTGIKWGANGQVDIVDGSISRLEVAGQLSAIAGQRVNVDMNGTVTYAKDGGLAADLVDKVGATWGQTRLGASGRLELKNKQLSLQDPSITGTFGNAASTLVDGSFGFDKGDPRIDLAAKGLGGKMSGNGSLVLDHGRIAHWSASGDFAFNNASVGVKLDSDGTVSANAVVTAGPANIAVGFSTNATYAEVPLDQLSPEQQRTVASTGGSFYEVTATVQHKVGATVDLPLTGTGGLTAKVSFGFKNDSTYTYDIIGLGPKGQKRPAVIGIREPVDVSTLKKTLAGGGSVTDQGDWTLAFNGNVTAGFGVGPATLSVNAGVVHQVSGNMKRTMTLEGGRIKIVVSRGDGKLTAASVGVTVGIDPSSLVKRLPGPIEQYAESLAKMVGSAATAGINHAWSDNDTESKLFEISFDPDNPRAQQALAFFLRGDLRDMQDAIDDPSGGVKLGKRLLGDVDVQLSKNTTNVSVLTAQSWQQFTSDVQVAIDGGQVKETMKLEADTGQTHLVDKDERETQAGIVIENNPATTKIGDNINLDAQHALAASPITGTAAFHYSVRDRDRAASIDPVATFARIADFHFAKKGHADKAELFRRVWLGLAQGNAPKGSGGFLGVLRTAFTGDDERMGKTNFALDGVFGQEGYRRLLAQDRATVAATYLDYEGVVKSSASQDKGFVLFSTAGIARKIAGDHNLGVARRDDGAYEYYDDKGQLRGTISEAQLTSIRDILLNDPDDKGRPNQGNIHLGMQRATEDQPLTLRFPQIGWLSQVDTKPHMSVFPNDWAASSLSLSAANNYANDFVKVQQLYQKTIADGQSMSAADFFDGLKTSFKDAMNQSGNSLSGRLTADYLAGEDSFTRVALLLSPEAAAALKLPEDGLRATMGNAPSDPIAAGVMPNWNDPQFLDHELAERDAAKA
jgi:hypothetical protein